MGECKAAVKSKWLAVMVRVDNIITLVVIDAFHAESLVSDGREVRGR